MNQSVFAVAVTLSLLAGIDSVPVQFPDATELSGRRQNSVPEKILSLQLTEPGDQSWVSIAKAFNLTSNDMELSYETNWYDGSRTVTLMRAAATNESSEAVDPPVDFQQMKRGIDSREREKEPRQWKRKIFGKDDRKKLPFGTTAQKSPHAAACKVSCGHFCRWSCTGTLIGLRHVLTSAHCVEKRSVRSLEVGFLQQNGMLHWYNVERVNFPLSRRVKRTRVRDDYAVLRLKRKTDRVPLTLYTPKISKGAAILYSAFHNDKGRKSLWVSKCKVTLATTNVIAGGSKCDAKIGSSGSGILMKVDRKGVSTYVVVGVLTGEVSVKRAIGHRSKILNISVRMNPSRVTQIQKWIEA